jgi:hypothetical protein
MAKILGFRYLLKNRNIMCNEMGLFKSVKILWDGVDHGKTLEKV